MRKLLTACGLALALAAPGMSSQAQTFTVAGSDLRDANGQSFVIRGINVPLAWYYQDVYNNIGAIRANTGANTLRLVWTAGAGSDEAWQAALRRTVEHKMIPMLELHDATGSNDPARLQQAANWWASKADHLKRPEVARHVLINIANEWSDWYMASPDHAPDVAVWFEAYKNAITTIRNAGIRSTLVIDGAGYGQDIQHSLKAYGRALMQHDPQHNLLFSVHLYCEWTNAAAIEQGLRSVKEAGLPILVGEFGNDHPPCGALPYRDVMRISQQHGLGYLAWSWKGNTPGQLDQLDMSRDWAGTSLTGWGHDVVHDANGLRATARTASVFGGSCGGQAPNGYPYCCDGSSTDPDGDGWGWENNRSCVVGCGASAPNGHPYCCNGSSTDPDGDGWGWENNRSCVVPGGRASHAASSLAPALADAAPAAGAMTAMAGAGPALQP
ncbi:cellulase family glycosylhydrolase [Eleftheria terrae]|uniref:cellulase family glycosylhydrolase n=1 Tax=Eleftheria terrae TaxID=1597781 RepID=UPI00263AD195|nr:cellulase family glycosylhydrolase [Eleftheria terrae]WKB55841.1 cellulase family glycosylhydrolase [Eleftheria terrae]